RVGRKQGSFGPSQLVSRGRLFHELMSIFQGENHARNPRRWLALCAALAVLAPAVASAWALSEDIDADPILYSASKPHDVVARLQERVDRGEVTLKYDEARGYLP